MSQRSRPLLSLSTTTGKSVLAICDQALLSGLSFAASVLVGRLASLQELGAFSLALTALFLCSTVQEALVTLPYTIRSVRMSKADRAEFAGSGIVQVGLWAGMTLLGLALAGALLTTGFGPPGLGPVLLVGATIVPFTLLRDFLRRMLIAHLQVESALILDTSVVTVQLIGLGSLAASGLLSARSALAAIGLGCAISAGTRLFLCRKQFDVRLGRVGDAFKTNWSLGKWMCAARITSVAQTYIVPWLLAILLDIRATGGFAACSTIVAVTNPLLMGVGLVLTPRLARAFADGGHSEVARVAKKATGLLLAGTSLFCVPLFLFGGEVLGLVYGAAYRPFGSTVSVLAVGLLANVVGLGVENGLRAMEKPQASLWSSLCGLLVTVTLAVTLVPTLGPLGGAISVLCGGAVSSAVRCVAFMSIVRTG